MISLDELQELAKLVRYYSLISTTAAGSGHPTSSLSAVELMVGLFFSGILKQDVLNRENPNNDRIIFSKGHASPLLYSLYAAAGVLKEDDMLTLRSFNSVLEGHPTPRFNLAEAATGSLGQGLSIGAGFALANKLEGRSRERVYVLLGDSEMAEGQVWEAFALASHYKLNNLIAILDVNRLGQRGETMVGYNTKIYQDRAHAFGWETIMLEDGHNIEEIMSAYRKAERSTELPVILIAKTKKGKGVSLFEDKENWHGKALSKTELTEALKELGEIKKEMIGKIEQPEVNRDAHKPVSTLTFEWTKPRYEKGTKVATREVYGDALIELGTEDSSLVVLDGEVSNSTYSEKFKKAYPDRFFEMFIAEQNMAGMAVGLARRGYIPFISTFAAFLTRAFDQLRMGSYSEANIKVVGSHSGVSIGSDGSSQMGLEDIAMMRSIRECVVLYPSDAVSAYSLIKQMHGHKGMIYLRTTREKTPVIYSETDEFVIGGSKVVYESEKDKVVIIAAGITLHEALKAYDNLRAEGIDCAVVDLYSVKPLDVATLKRLAEKTKKIITVEDHYSFGGIGEAVNTALKGTACMITNLSVTKTPRSATPAEIMAYEEIDSAAIIFAVKKLL